MPGIYDLRLLTEPAQVDRAYAEALAHGLVAKGVIRALDLREGNTVVDLGSGAGYFSLRLFPAVILARAVGKGCTFSFLGVVSV